MTHLRINTTMICAWLMWFIMVLFALSCDFSNKNNQADKNAVFDQENDSMDQKDRLHEYYNRLQVKRDNGLFLRYLCKDEQLFVEYGKGAFNNTFDPSRTCDLPYAGTPTLWKDNDEMILLNFACGNACWRTYHLPLKTKDTIQSYSYPYAFDKMSNILIHFDFDESKDDYVLMARNLITRKSENIDLAPCESAYFFSCIDSIRLEKSDLSIYMNRTTTGLEVIQRKLKI